MSLGCAAKRVRGCAPDTLPVRMLRWSHDSRQRALCPVCSVPAFRHRERSWRVDGRTVQYLEAMSYAQWFNILGLPAAVVPVTRSQEGLPIGVQVVGRPWEEEAVLAVAAEIERACGGWQEPPIECKST